MTRLFDTPPKLKGRQAFVYELMGHTPMSAAEVGGSLHLWQGKNCGCTPYRECEWAATSGREVLEALRKKGLLRYDRHHIYRRTDQPTAQTNDLPPDY